MKVKIGKFGPEYGCEIDYEYELRSQNPHSEENGSNQGMSSTILPLVQIVRAKGRDRLIGLACFQDVPRFMRVLDFTFVTSLNGKYEQKYPV